MWSKIDRSKLKSGKIYSVRMVYTSDVVNEKPYDIMVEMSGREFKNKLSEL